MIALEPTSPRTPGWTASALIALPDPPHGYPLFNARNTYDDPRHDLPSTLYAVDGNHEERALLTHGTFHAWMVLSDGTQLAWPLRTIVNGCLDELMPEVLNGGSFLPDGETCPLQFYDCGPGRFHCEFEP